MAPILKAKVKPLLGEKPVWITKPGPYQAVEESLIDLLLDAKAPARVTYAVVGGDFPRGARLDPHTGHIGSRPIGVPAPEGVYTFTVRATNTRSGVWDDASFTIVIQDTPNVPRWITPAILPATQEDATVLVQLSTSQDVTYELVSGELPQGVLLDGATGVITGVAPRVGPSGAVAMFTIRATDIEGNYADRTFTLDINNVDHTPLWLSNDSFVMNESSESTVQLNATTTSTGLRYELVQGELPSGLVLNASSGSITGTAPLVGASGQTWQFEVAAVSNHGERSAKMFTIRVLDVPHVPVWAPQAPITLLEEQTVQVQLSATSDQPFTVRVVSSTLPPEIEFDLDNLRITGTAPLVSPQGAVYEITLAAENQFDERADITVRISVADIDRTPVWETRALGDQFEETAIDVPLRVRSMNPYVISLVTGSLPPGVQLDTTSNKLVGTVPLVPPTGETYTFVLRATNDLNEFSDVTLKLRVIDVAHTPTWITQSLGSYVEHTAISETLTASSTTSITYSVVAGSLPPGVQLDGTTGRITGTAPEVDKQGKQFEITARVTARTGEYMDRNFVLTVTDLDLTPAWQTATIADQLEETDIQEIQLTAQSTSMPLTYRVVGGSLPSGIAITTAGALQGKTPSVLEDTDFTFAVRASNPRGEHADRNFTMRIKNIPNVPQWQAPFEFEVDERTTIDIALTATVARGSISYVMKSSKLPSSVQLRNGKLVGTAPEVPAEGETFEFTVTATASTGEQMDQQFQLKVKNVNRAPVWETPETLPSVISDSAVSFTIVAKDPDGDTVSYSMIAGSLPVPLTLSATGVVSGTLPDSYNSSETFSFTVRATDTLGGLSNRTFRLSVVVNPSKYVNRNYVVNEAYYWDKPSSMGQVDI